MQEGKWVTVIVLLTVLTIIMGYEAVGILVDEAEAETVNIERVEKVEEIEKAEIVEEELESEVQAEESEEKDMIARPYGKLSEEEREYIIKVVAAEARGESMMCMMATAQTIRDRALEWDKDIMKIVKSPNQFADPYEGPLSDEVRDKLEYSVDKVIVEGFTVVPYPVLNFFSERYISKENWPSWAYTKEYIMTIDDERFYR